MPGYKNSFTSPTYIEETILNSGNGKIGTIRVKPSSILWRPKGKGKFFAVPLDKFQEWISHPETKAREVTG